jgi:hypothetical protein
VKVIRVNVTEEIAVELIDGDGAVMSTIAIRPDGDYLEIGFGAGTYSEGVMANVESPGATLVSRLTLRRPDPRTEAIIAEHTVKPDLGGYEPGPRLRKGWWISAVLPDENLAVTRKGQLMRTLQLDEAIEQELITPPVLATE